MNKTFLLFTAVAIPALVPSAGDAQESARDTARTAPIVVTATRTPLPADRVPATVTVITGAALRAQGITTVVDALRQVPGLSVVQSGSYGALASLFIRGGESKFTKVLVDGVPANDAGGAFDFSSLSTDNIDRIEIVRGPGSVLYGSDAMAGVVQLFTRRGTAGVHSSLAARGGGYGSRDLDASVRGGVRGVDYSAAGARHRTDGIQRFNSEFRQDVGSGTVGATSARSDARVSIRGTSGVAHFPTDGSGQVVDSNAVRRGTHMELGLDAGVKATDALDLRVLLASHTNHGVTDNAPDSPGDSLGYYYSTGDRSSRRSADLRADYRPLGWTTLTAGVAVERADAASNTESNFGPSAYDAARSTRAAYAQAVLLAHDRATFTGGARVERNDTFGSFFTWRAAASTRLGVATRVRAGVGTSFREPTFLESFGGGFVIGNPALSPERAASVELALEQELGRGASFSLTGFRNDFRDLIDYRYSATKPNYFNIAATRSTGVELGLLSPRLRGFAADGSLSYVDARVIDAGTSTAVTATFAAGSRLLRRPLHTLSAGVSYRGGGAALDLRAQRVGDRADVYYAPDFSASRVVLPAYTRVDLSGERPVPGVAPLTLSLRAENLFDAHYAELAGFNGTRLSDGDVARQSAGYRAPGRRVLVGARLAW